MTQPSLLRERAIRDTVQKLPDADQGSFVVRVGQMRYPTLPDWGTRNRERVLRWWYRHPYSWMIQGAFAGLINKWLATPWTLEGAKTGINSAGYFQEVLRDAEFGEGWDAFWGKVWLDFLRQDGGAYIEVIAPGDPTQPIRERITGLAHLDSLRCYPTGDPEFPAIYYNADGTKHKLHAERVIHLVDMPDGDEFNPGYGLCALSRAIAIVEQMYYQNRYIREQMDELPPPGFALLYGMTEETFLQRVDTYVERKNRDLPPPYGNLILLPSLIKKGEGISLDIQSFSQPPEKFDYPTWVNLQVNALALVLGIDKQEIWELSGAGIGTGAQSQVLHMKSQGKMYGHMLSLAERHLNDALPDSAELTFEPSDAYESQEAAAMAKAWVAAINGAKDTTPDERRQLLVNTVEQFKDVLTNEAGELIKLPDSDVKPDDQAQMGDAKPAPEQAQNAAPVTTDSQNAQQATKDFDATRAEFVGGFTDLLKAGDEMTRRRTGTVLRAQLSRLGRKAFDDGLKDGGVADGMDDDDRAAFAVWLAQQSRFVTNFLDKSYKEGLSEAQISQHADMWANVSLREAYQMGLASADRNGLYEWQLGLTEKHCVTCAVMDGQRHRMKDYMRKRILPGNFNLACHGVNCDCRLVKTSGKAAGRWAQTTETLSALMKE